MLQVRLLKLGVAGWGGGRGKRAGLEWLPEAAE